MRPVLLMLALAAMPATAQPLLLFDKSVLQYREAAGGVKKHVADAVELSPSDPKVAEAAPAAPVIIAVGQTALAAAKKHAPEVPTIFCMVLGMNRAGITANVTGVPLEPDPEVVLQRLARLAPRVRRVGFLHDPASSDLLAQYAERAASAAKLELVPITVSAPGQVVSAVAQKAGQIDALWVAPNPRLISKEVVGGLIATSLEKKLPLVGFLTAFTDGGALMALQADYGDNGDQAGKLALEVLAKPADKRKPVPAPVFLSGALSINLKTATELGLDVSGKALADAKVIK